MIDIYDEFVDVIRDLIDKIIAYDFDQVLYGNGQPMSQGLRETVILSSRPIVPGETRNLIFRNVMKEDLIDSENLAVLREEPKPPLYLDEIVEDNDGELPPLDRNQVSFWEVDGLEVYSNVPHHSLMISVRINVTLNEISCDLIHIY